MEHRTLAPEELIGATLSELEHCRGVTLFKLEPFVLHVVECLADHLGAVQR